MLIGARKGYTISTSGGDVEITPNAGLHAHASDALSLAVQRVLSASPALHAHTGDSASLTVQGSEPAADFFVDFDGGNDANLGTTQGAPWRTLPGTRVTAVSGSQAAYRSNWGDITTGNRVPAGSIIEVRAGTTHTSAVAGRMYIFSDYYVPPTQGNETIIRTSSTWGTGDVTIDCTGMSSFDSSWELNSIRLSHIRLTGRASSYWILTDNPGTCRSLFGIRGTSGTHVTNVGASYIRVLNANTDEGISINRCNNVFITEFEVARIGFGQTLGMGICCGNVDDHWTYGLLFENGVVRECGTNAPSVPLDFPLAHGIQLTNSGTLAARTVFRNVESWGHGRDGFDMGMIRWSGESAGCHVDIVNCYFHNNFEDGLGCNSQSGTPDGTVTSRVFNTIIDDRIQAYDGVWLDMYHCTCVGPDQVFVAYSESGGAFATRLFLRNNYFRSGSTSLGMLQTYNNFNGVVIDSDYNVWANPGGSLNDIHFSSATGWPPSGYSEESYNTWAEFGANDIRTTTGQAFVNEAGGNFHLANDTGVATNIGPRIDDPVEAATDRDGNPRAATIDAGAYEYAV